MITASISGKLAFDPCVLQTKTRKAMTTARLACNDDNGNILWIDLLTFNHNVLWLARACKCDRIAAMGTLQLNVWTGKDGEEKSVLQLLVDNLIVPAPKPKKSKQGETNV